MGEFTSDPFTIIPDAAIEADARQTAADDWASKQRVNVAQMWADNARAQAQQLFGGLGSLAGGAGQSIGGAMGQVGEMAGNALGAAANVSDVLTAKPLREGIVGAIGEQARSGGLAGQIIAPYSAEELPQVVEANPASSLMAQTLNKYVPPQNAQQQEQINRLSLAGGGLALGMGGEPINPAGAGGAAARAAADAQMQAALTRNVQNDFNSGIAKALQPKQQAALDAAKAVPEGANPITLTAEQEVQRLRLDKFPEWAREPIQQAATDVNFAREQRRGVVPVATSEQMADDMGRTVEQWIRQGKAGKAYNTEETRALRNAITSQAENVNAITQRVADAKASGDITDAMLAQAMTEGEKLQSLMTVAEGARAEWGRAGLAWRAATRNVASPIENIQRIYKKVGGRDNALQAVDEYNQMVQQGATPIQMAQYWSRVERPPAGFNDWFQLLRFNSMLSGPRTFEINLVGNSLELPWRLARDAGASLVRKRPEEMAPELAGAWAGLQRGVQPFMEALSHGITTEQALAGDIPRALSSRVRNPVGRGIATALEAPGRINTAVDEMSKSIAYSMGLGRQAALTASREGLRGQAWNARVAELMANPSDGMIKAAGGIADRMIYKGDMGALGNALGGVQRVPYLGNILLPFLRTVYHITARGIDRSPVGIVGTLADVARTRGRYATGQEIPKGAVPFGERVGDNIMGLVTGAALTGYAMQGNISAAGPDNANQKDLLRSTGWQPYSVKIGNNWVSYSNWGPLAGALGMAGAAAEANLYGKPGDAPGIALDTFSRFAKLGTEQAYLQGIGAFYKAINDPERYGTSWLTGFMNSLVPFGSAINTLGQATDPYQRQAQRPSEVGLGESLRQSLVGRFPGARQSLQTSQDAFGKPVENITEGPRAFQPLRVSPIEQDATTRALLDAGVGVGSGPKTISNIPLTPQEQRQFESLAGEQIRTAIAKALEKPAYQRASPDGKKRILGAIVAAGRDYAGGQILKQVGTATIRERLNARRSQP